MLAGLIAPAALLAGFAAAFSGGAEPNGQLQVELRPVERPSVAPSQSTATPSPMATPAATEAPATTPEPTPEAPPSVTSIEQLTSEYGEPPGATLGRFRIPVLGIDAPLAVRAVGTGGTMPNPYGPSDVAWYDFTAWDGYGGAIGGGANAIFSGHVDYADTVPWAGTEFRGRGVFFGLELLSPGDLIEIDVGDERRSYAVQWQRQVAASDAGAWAELLSSDVERDSITIITCGGQFNTAERSYLDRVVVRAVRI